MIHPVCNDCPSAVIGDGTFVAARAIVAPAAVVGEGVIINHGAIVDHECFVGNFCHVAPGATLAGNVRLGERVLVGAGANILPGIRIGDAAIIGAGAVVTADVPPGINICGRARPPNSLKDNSLDITEICITRNSTIREALDMLDRSGLGVLLLVERRTQIRSYGDRRRFAQAASGGRVA